MPKAIDRILEVLQELGLSARQFDMSIGSANGYTLRMHKNKASVGSDVIEKIVRTYPQINLVWLITGKGSMFITKQKENLINDINLERLEKLIEQKIESKFAKDSNQLVQKLVKEINNEIIQTKKKLNN